MKGILVYLFIISVISVALFPLAYLLTIYFGDKCWLPRIGALIVGCSVALQGWVLFDPRKRGCFDTRQPEKRVLKYVIGLALVGTLLWAFGDMQKILCGIAVCR